MPANRISSRLYSLITWACGWRARSGTSLASRTASARGWSPNASSLGSIESRSVPGRNDVSKSDAGVRFCCQMCARYAGFTRVPAVILRWLDAGSRTSQTGPRYLHGQITSEPLLFGRGMEVLFAGLRGKKKYRSSVSDRFPEKLCILTSYEFTAARDAAFDLTRGHVTRRTFSAAGAAIFAGSILKRHSDSRGVTFRKRSVFRAVFRTSLLRFRVNSICF